MDVTRRADLLADQLIGGHAAVDDLLDLAIDLVAMIDPTAVAAPTADGVLSFPIVGLPDGFVGTVLVSPDGHGAIDPLVISVDRTDVALPRFGARQDYSGQKLSFTLGSSEDHGSYFSSFTQQRLHSHAGVAAALDVVGEQRIGAALVVGESSAHFTPIVASAVRDGEELYVALSAEKVLAQDGSLPPDKLDHLAATLRALRGR